MQGLSITDQTNFDSIPAGTTIAALEPGFITLSQPLAGVGVQVGDRLVTSSRGGPYIRISGGGGQGQGGMGWSTDGAINAVGMTWDGYHTAWEMRGELGLSEIFPGLNYIGYQSNTGLVAPTGIALSNYQAYIGEERTLESGVSAPTEPTHLQGDMRLASAAVSGGNIGWVNVPVFTTTLSGGVVGGTTTSFAVAACPSPAAPAGTPVIDTTGYQTSITHREQLLGRFSACSGERR